MNKQKSTPIELIALMAALMSIVALAIDALLPALNYIGIAIGTKQASDNQLLITMIFLGLGLGPLFFGPISDSLGRKPIVYIGFGIFIIASFICVSATSLEMMVLGRILQGIGLSAPRTISIAMVRDTFSGDYMARIMSFITVVFILVPVVAPTLGKFVLDHYNWQGIFYIQLLFSILVSFWFWLRQPETLPKVKRIKFTGLIFLNGLKEILKSKRAVGFTLISGFVTGSFMVYLSTAQQIFQNQYGLVDQFPIIFSGLAIAVGGATFLNGTLVVKFGMQKMVAITLLSFFSTSLLYIILFHNSYNPNIVILLIFCGLQFLSIGFLFGNLRALAMQPIGHIAGIGAAITGFISTTMAVPISIYIGKFVITSALPLFIGFAICSAFALCILLYLKNASKTVLKQN
jgi:DHA1 family bicyclomycin/chloramphenicol resistance-like MFS transporter